jgi:transposase-like protein
MDDITETGTDAMADELLVKATADPDTDLLRDGVRVLAEALMDLELEAHLGAGRYERTGERSGYRNGTRERRWDTLVDPLDVRVPRVRIPWNGSTARSSGAPTWR